MTAVLALAILTSSGAPVTGNATWYRYHQGQAAAGPGLREALGAHWRGQRVKVCAKARCVTVRLTDWCLCPRGHRVVDLDVRDFARLADPGRGVIPALPPTDTAPDRGLWRNASRP